MCYKSVKLLTKIFREKKSRELNLIVISVLMIHFVSSVPIFDGGSSVYQQNLTNCTKDSDERCFYKWIDPTHSGAFNTKQQRRPYKRFCIQTCGRAGKYPTIYSYADDQNSDDCKHALRLGL